MEHGEEIHSNTFPWILNSKTISELVTAPRTTKAVVGGHKDLDPPLLSPGIIWGQGTAEEREQEGEEGGRGRSSSGEATCLLIPTREQLRRLLPARRSSGHSSGEQQWLWTNGCGRMVVNNGCGRMVVNNDCKIWL